MEYQFGGETGQSHGAADGGVASAERLDHENVLEATQPLTGIDFRKVDADKTQITGLAPYFFRKLMMIVPFEGQIFVKFTFDEILNGLLYFLLCFVQLELHASCPPGVFKQTAGCRTAAV